jgi:hypothetical protein
MLHGADSSERQPELTWPVVGCVCHRADNLRIGAERLVGLAAGDTRPVARYDPDRLARARRDAGWCTPTGASSRFSTWFVPTPHEASHHCWDVGRTMACHRSGADLR